MKHLQSLVKMKEDYAKRITKEGKQALSNELADFFKENPKIVGVKWNQYTPYFNDGEECVFRFNEYSLKFKLQGADEEAGEDGDGWFGEYDTELKTNKLESVRNKLAKQLESAKDILKEVFGDHQEITILIENGNVKVETEDYDHD